MALGRRDAEGARARHELRRVEIDRARSVREIVPSIVEVARDWDADLVVIGTHGRRGFARLLVGSVAEDLVRTATTSLMLVREQEQPPVAGAA